METGPGSRYDPITISLHWLTALMIVALWVIGRIGDFFPSGPWRTNIWSIHVALGFALAHPSELGSVPIETEDAFSLLASALFDQLLKGLAILVLCTDQSVPLMAIALARKFGFHLILLAHLEIFPRQEIPCTGNAFAQA